VICKDCGEDHEDGPDVIIDEIESGAWLIAFRRELLKRFGTSDPEVVLRHITKAAHRELGIVIGEPMIRLGGGHPMAGRES
jgi:hypothetical protein